MEQIGKRPNQTRRLKQAVEERPWLTVRYLRRMIYEGRIPYAKVGGQVLVDLADVDRLVEANRHESSA